MNFFFKIILLICYLAILLYLFLFSFKQKNFYNDTEKNIFMYWEGDTIDLVNHCINRVKNLNQDWTVHILSKNDIPFHLNSFQQKTYPSCRSDLIRLLYLEKYGGLWLDATIINLIPVTKWLSFLGEKYYLQKENDILIGYSYPGEERIMESWLFYCSKNCSFMKLWKDEFLFALSIGFKQYCSIFKEFYKKEYPKDPLFLPYLTIHLCFSVVKKRNQYKTKIILLPSCEGPYHYLSSHYWNQEKAVESLQKIQKKNEKSIYFIKLRQTERKRIQQTLPSRFEKDSILYNLYFS